MENLCLFLSFIFSFDSLFSSFPNVMLVNNILLYNNVSLHHPVHTFSRYFLQCWKKKVIS